MQWTLNIAWFIYLWALGIADIRDGRVSRTCLIYGWILTVISIYIEGNDRADIILGGMLACIFILVSRCTREALGYGDSIMIALVSLRFGGYSAIYIVAAAFGMAAIYGGVKGWNQEVPFLPYLAMGCTLSMILG